MTPIQKKIARRRELMILAEGLAVEIAVEIGAPEEARRHQREMYALIAARDAQIQQLEEEGGESYFALAGQFAGFQAEARRAAP